MSGVRTSLKRFVTRRPALLRGAKAARYAGLRWASRACGWSLDERPRILGYHAVGDGANELSVSVEQFRRQIHWLTRRQYRFLTLRQWWQQRQRGEAIAPRSVVLSFDDGFRSVWTRALPILRAEGIPATIFPLTDQMGGSNAFDRPLQRHAELPLLSWDELDGLARAGWDVQSHGAHHYPMVRLRPAVLDDELQRSKQLFERRLGQPVDFFCYPYGVFDATTIEAVRRAGYAGAVTCRSGPLSETEVDDACYRLPRTLIDGLMTAGDFDAIFRRGYLALSAWEATGRRRRGQDTCGFDYLESFAHLGIFEPEASWS